MLLMGHPTAGFPSSLPIEVTLCPAPGTELQFVTLIQFSFASDWSRVRPVAQFWQMKHKVTLNVGFAGAVEWGRDRFSCQTRNRPEDLRRDSAVG